MSIRPILLIFTLALLLAPASRAEEVRYYEKDGVTYCETRRVTEQRVPETRLAAQPQTVYRTEPTTTTQDVVRVYWTPVTEYRLETFWVGRWNPLVEPYLAYRYVPRTHWEQKTEVVKMPVATRRVVAETRTVRAPVASYRTVQQEIITRTAVSGNPQSESPTVGSAPQVAQRPQVGGIRRLDNDPPRYGATSGWHAAGTVR